MPTQRLTELPDTVLRLIEETSGPVIDTGTISAGLNSTIAARAETPGGAPDRVSVASSEPRRT